MIWLDTFLYVCTNILKKVEAQCGKNKNLLLSLENIPWEKFATKSWFPSHLWNIVWKGRRKHVHYFYRKMIIFSVKSTFLQKSWFHGNFLAWSCSTVRFISAAVWNISWNHHLHLESSCFHEIWKSTNAVIFCQLTESFSAVWNKRIFYYYLKKSSWKHFTVLRTYVLTT